MVYKSTYYPQFPQWGHWGALIRIKHDMLWTGLILIRPEQDLTWSGGTWWMHMVEALNRIKLAFTSFVRPPHLCVHHICASTTFVHPQHLCVHQGSASGLRPTLCLGGSRVSIGSLGSTDQDQTWYAMNRIDLYQAWKGSNLIRGTWWMHMVDALNRIKLAFTSFVRPPHLCVHLICVSTLIRIKLDQPKAGSNMISSDQKGNTWQTDIQLYINR